MKIVINRCFGSFHVSNELMNEWNRNHPNYPLDPWDFGMDSMRVGPEFISYVESFGPKASTTGSQLEIATLPDDITDYMIDEYDGIEHIIYVQNGKLHHCWGDS